MSHHFSSAASMIRILCRCTSLAFTVLFLLAGMQVSAENSQFQEDIARLTEGVEKIAKPGVPGPIACVSENSFPVILGKADGFDQAVVAAARFGKGRVVAFGHDGFLRKPALDEADTGQLVANAAQWAVRIPNKGKAKLVAGLVFALDLAKPLERLGFEVKFLSCPGWKDELEGIDLLVGDNLLPDEKHELALADFVSNGGGFLTAGLAWGWMQLNHHLNLLRDHPLNRVLAPMGIAFIDGYFDEVQSGKTGDCQWLRRGHAIDALNTLQETNSGQPDQQEQALAVVSAAFRWLPEGDSPFRDRVKSLAEKAPRPIVPTRKSPLRRASPGRLALNVEHMDSLIKDAISIQPSDSAADYPGAPPNEAPRVSQELEINTAVPGWASTGLWAMAGEAVDVSTFVSDATLTITGTLPSGAAIQKSPATFPQRQGSTGLPILMVDWLISKCPVPRKKRPPVSSKFR